MLGTYTIKRHIPKFINYDQVAFLDMAFKSENGLFLSGFDVGINKFSSSKEPYLKPTPASFSADGYCQMTFAHTRRTCACQAPVGPLENN